MGEAKRRKLAGNYPDQSRPQDRFASSATCPCCNVRRVMLHMLGHNREVRTFDGKPVVYPLGEADEEISVCDFGVLAVILHNSTATVIVKAFGEEVMMLRPEGFEIVSPGPWIEALTNIRKMLDARFGPVSLGQRQPHMH
jgi:hypothetical protein